MGEEAGVALADLPLEPLVAIAAALSEDKDVAALSQTCRRLRAACAQDAAWESVVRCWLDSQPAESGVRFADPRALCSQLSLSGGLKELAEALHKLGAWPAGLWAANDGVLEPRGALLSVVFDGRGFEAKAFSGRPAAAAQLWRAFSVSIIPAAAGRRVGVELRMFCICQPGLCIGQGLTLAPAEALKPMAGPGLVLGENWYGPELVPVPFITEYSSFFNLEGQALHFARVRRPPQLAEQAQLNPLARLRGVYAACYGSHGMEALLLSMESTPPPACPARSLHLSAVKLTGDPNVPAHRHSFVAEVSGYTPGPYDSDRDDPFPIEAGVGRPVTSVVGDHVHLVVLEERPVVARCPGWGQINRTPGDFQPEWVRVTLLLYDGRQFSVIFEDEGSHFRHMMDFTPLPPEHDVGGAAA